MKCPCEDCLCIPICRHKHYYTLFHECLLISIYVENPYLAKICINEIKITEKFLKPSSWEVYNNVIVTGRQDDLQRRD